MNIEFQIIEHNAEKSRICKTVIADLPEWFGIPESNAEYCKGVKDHDFIKIVFNNNLAGFCSIKKNNEYTAEIYVMGLLKKYHRMGIGINLIQFLEVYLIDQGFVYLEVKTLDESHNSFSYKKTRLFYKKAGFLPLDVQIKIWGKENPCLIMVKKL